MRISDWSSDVCSSDLAPGLAEAHRHGPGAIYWQMNSDGFSAIGPMDDDNRWFFMPGGAAPGTSLSKKDAETLIAKSTGIDLSYDVIDRKSTRLNSCH